MKSKKTVKCLNCGQRINNANYCSKCGQLNVNKRLPLKQFIKDFFGDYLTFDSRFFRSLFPLMAKPGYLTREYVSGRRMQFVFPLRLYIFTTLLFFFIIAVNSKLDQSHLESQVKELEQQKANIDSIITMINGNGKIIPSDSLAGLKKRIDKKYIIRAKNLSGESHITFKPLKDSTAAKSRFGQYINKKTKYFASKGEEGARLITKEIINQIPKVLFLLLPVFALILKLLYVRHNIYYVEHLVFAVHFHTFIFILILLPVFYTRWFTILFFMLGVILYLFLAMKNVYQQKLFKTVLKFSLLTFLYIAALIPASAMLMIVSLISV